MNGHYLIINNPGKPWDREYLFKGSIAKSDLLKEELTDTIILDLNNHKFFDNKNQKWIRLT